MSMDSYEDAFKTLFKYCNPSKAVGKNETVTPYTHRPELLEQAKKFFIRCGHKLEELSKLNAIHVAGTKGKGSVSVMCESILRRYGLKTGLLTSPHLIEMRERIQINGCPLTREQFASYFWEVFRKFENSKTEDEDMPNFYRFFTFLAFHVFLCEEVDVAVIEVGKGGAFDSTNILISPVACGITLMDMDHVNVLGDTLEKITWHKAGICKPGSPMIILPQKPGPLKVIAERATEIGVSSLEVIPDLHEYAPKKISIGLRGEHNKLNASLAVQLCKKWLISKGMWDGQHSCPSMPDESLKYTDNSIPLAQPFELPEQFLVGLELCSLPGRSQIERRNGATFYLDVAHTPLSVKACAKWFQDEAADEIKALPKSHSRVMKVLLFNFLHVFRDRYALLEPLQDCDFDYALFAPSFSGGDGTNTLDQTWVHSQKTLNEVSTLDEQAWQKLHSVKHSTASSIGDGSALVLSKQSEETNSQAKTRVFPSLDHAIEWVCRGRGVTVKSTSPEMLSEVPPTPDDLKSASHLQVLVTGSTRIVGSALYVIGTL